eukprot:3989871-Prymnesium_polylepis.2
MVPACAQYGMHTPAPNMAGGHGRDARGAACQRGARAPPAPPPPRHQQADACRRGPAGRLPGARLLPCPARCAQNPRRAGGEISP